MSEPIQIIIRAMTTQDQPFIYATWLRGIFYDIKECIRPDQDRFFTSQSKRIAQILASPNTKVRIAGDTTDLLWIAGYSISEGPDLHWAYVRADFRRKGIAGHLIAPLGITHVRSLTKIGAEISEKKGFVFRPQGDPDVSRDKDSTKDRDKDQQEVT